MGVHEHGVRHRAEARTGRATKVTAEYKGGVLTVTVPYDEHKRGAKAIKVRKAE